MSFFDLKSSDYYFKFRVSTLYCLNQQVYFSQTVLISASIPSVFRQFHFSYCQSFLRILFCLSSYLTTIFCRLSLVSLYLHSLLHLLVGVSYIYGLLILAEVILVELLSFVHTWNIIEYYVNYYYT